MASFDIDSTASSVFGIAGQGMGLMLLAGTSRAVMDTMYGDKWRPPNRTRRTQRRPKRRPQQRLYYQRPYRPRYRW